MLKLPTLMTIVAFSVGLPHAKAQTPTRPQTSQPQVPATSICTGTVAGTWAPTQSTDGPLTITVRGETARGVYVYRGRRITLAGRISGDSISGTWTMDAPATVAGNRGDFVAKFDSRQHTLEVMFRVGGALSNRSA